jgi:hypothetical protein
VVGWTGRQFDPVGDDDVFQGFERKRVARPGPRRPPFVIQVFTLLFVAFPEGVFRGEFSSASTSSRWTLFFSSPR